MDRRKLLPGADLPRLEPVSDEQVLALSRSGEFPSRSAEATGALGAAIRKMCVDLAIRPSIR